MAVNILAAFKDIADDTRFIQDIREVAVSKLFYEDTTNFFTIIPGIKGGQQVAAMRGIEYITRKDQGCGGTSLAPAFPAIEQKWNPKVQEIKIKYCYTDFMSKFTQWGLANGYNIHKLDESTFFQFLQDLIIEAMKLDMQRIVLFGDENINGQSILTDEAGKSPFYDTIEKGLIPTLEYFNTIPELASNISVLPQNALANSGLQYTFGSEDSKNIFESLVDSFEFDGDTLLTNWSLYKNYADFFKDMHSVGIQSSKDEVQNGIQNLKVDGENIVPMKNYDRWRKNDFQTGAPLVTHLPHFAIFTKKEHLQVGVDDSNALTDLTLEYVGGDDESFYIKGNYMLDFKMTNPYEFKAAI